MWTQKVDLTFSLFSWMQQRIFRPSTFKRASLVLFWPILHLEGWMKITSSNMGGFMKNMDIYLNSPSNVTNTLHYLVTRSIIAILYSFHIFFLVVMFLCWCHLMILFNSSLLYFKFKVIIYDHVTCRPV